MPQELSNAQGQLVWQASYKTWGSTVAEEWEAKTLEGASVHPLDRGDLPQDSAERQQNLRFQGQYLDRETGLHYNTFRYFDADVGRFVCPDPIGVLGGMNLGSYAPNPFFWIDPTGLCRRGNAQTKAHMEKVRDQVHADNPGISHQAGGRRNSTAAELPETYLAPLSGSGRKGGSYTDMTFKDAQGRTVYVQTVDKGKVNGMSQREWNNAVRITQQNPNAIVITVPKGSVPTPGSLNTSGMTPGTVQAA